MTLTRTFPTDRAAGLPLADTRLLVAAMVESDTTGKPRAGVLPSHYNPLVTGTTGMAYQVATFAAVTVRAGMGAELVANDGAVSVATTAAPGANSRIDVIWVRSLFTTTGDSGTDPVFGVTQGTAAASPSKPSIPAGALELATAVVLSTTTQTSTAVITQTYPYTAAEGGVVCVRNSTELTEWTPADGAHAYRIDNKGLYERVSGAWLPILIPKAAFTPAWTNFTVGASPVTAWSQVQGSMCEGVIQVTLASGWAMNTSDITFSLPVSPVAVVEGLQIGWAAYRDAGTGDYRGAVLMDSSGKGRLVWEPGGQAYFGGVKGSEPFGWATGDGIRIYLRYETA